VGSNLELLDENKNRNSLDTVDDPIRKLRRGMSFGAGRKFHRILTTDVDKRICPMRKTPARTGVSK
jgi:hypothetical protein